MKLLLVDDNQFYLPGLKNLLEQSGFEVLGMAGSGLEAVAKVEMLHPDMILMDVQMDGCDGIETTRLIKRDFPDITIVMLTVSEDDEHLFAAIRAGASGYLLKTMEMNRFPEELRRLAAGETPLSSGLAWRVLTEFAGQKQDDQPPQPMAEDQPELSSRQIEVLKLLTQGLTYREIGEVLSIRHITVRYHVNEILAKLHLANRAQLIVYASRLKL